MTLGARGAESVPPVTWFAWRDLAAAYQLARAGGIALHLFRHDLRRFGFSATEAACHIISADRQALVSFGSRVGLRAAWIEPPRRHRPDLWHFDAFGGVLARLLADYPLPEGITWPIAATKGATNGAGDEATS